MEPVSGGSLGEDDVDPVVGRPEGVVGEGAGGVVGVGAVAAADAVLEGVQGWVVHAGGGEAVVVAGVAPHGGEVRGDVDGACRDRDRGGEVHLLPSGGALVGEGRGGELGSGGGPQGADVGAGVAGALVEADAGDLAAHVGLELHAEFDGGGVGDAGVGRCGGGGPDGAGH